MKLLNLLLKPILRHLRVYLPATTAAGHVHVLYLHYYTLIDFLILLVALRLHVGQRILYSNYGLFFCLSCGQCLKHPGILFSKKRRTQWLAEKIRSQQQQGNPVFLAFFCRKLHYLKTQTRYRVKEYRLMSELLKAQPLTLRVIPTLIVFSKRPIRYKKVYTEYHTRLKDFIFNYKESAVRTKKAFTLALPQNLAVRELKKRLRHARYHALSILKEEIKIVKGPILLSRKQVMHRLLYAQPFLRYLRTLTLEERKAVKKRAINIYHGMLPNFSMPFIKFFNSLLTWLYRHIFEHLRVNEAGFIALRKLSAQYPVILIPNHGSHMDYLLLSYVFFKRDAAVPYIAAGENLNYFPLGYLFRKSGAFFIKRVYQDDMLYPMLLREYLTFLLTNKYSIEFYIEGTRTRTGGLLQPMTGFLRLLTRIVHQTGAADLYIVPVSIAYDRVIEDAVLINEDQGAAKRAETIEGVFNLHNYIKKNYKNVYTHFSAPISVRQFLTNRVGRGSKRYTKQSVLALANHVMSQISAHMPVTGSAMLATCLCTERKWLSKRVIGKRLSALSKVLEAHSADHPEQAFIDAYLSFFQKQGWLIQSRESGITLFRVNDSQATLFLRFYANAICQFFFEPSLLAMLLIRHGPLPMASVQEKLQHMLAVMDLEYFPVKEANARKGIQHALYMFLEHCCTYDPDMLRFFSDLTYHVRVAYCIVFISCRLLAKRCHHMVQADLIGRILAFMQLLYKTGYLMTRSSISKTTCTHALTQLLSRKLLSLHKNHPIAEQRILALDKLQTTKVKALCRGLILPLELSPIPEDILRTLIADPPAERGTTP